MKELLMVLVTLAINSSACMVGYGMFSNNDTMFGFGVIQLILSVAMEVLVLVAY